MGATYRCLVGNSLRTDTSGASLLSPYGLKGSQVWQLNQKEMISLLSDDTQEHTGSPNRSKRELVQCFCTHMTWLSYKKEKSQSVESPACQKNPRWESYLGCNQEWLLGMNQRLWRGEQSNVCLVCGCHFPWQLWPVSVLLEIMSNHLFLSLPPSIWDNEKWGK